MSRKTLSRREFLHLSAMAAGATLLAGCASSTPAPAAEAPQEEAEVKEETAAAEAPAKENAEIRYASFDWFAYVPGVKWDQYNQEQAFPKYKEDHPNVELLWEPHGDGWEDKVLTQMAAGTAPDIMATWPPILNTWAEKKQLLDLQPLVDRDLPNADELFIKSAWEQMWDPISQIRMGMITDVDVTSVYYNKKAFEEAGVPLPTPDWDINDYTEAAVALTQKDDSGQVTRWGGQLRPDFVLGYFYYVEAFGGKVRDAETMMTCTLDAPEAQEALEWIRQGMWDLNCFGQNNQIDATGIPNTWTGSLPANIVAFAERSADQFFALSDGMEEGSWDIAHVPKGPKDQACMGAPDCWVVYKEVTNRGNLESVWEMMKWISTGDYYQENVATMAGRIPGLLTAAEKWPDILRGIDSRLKNVQLEVVIDQLRTGEARGPQLFRFQAAAEELIIPAMEQIYIEGSAPVSTLQDVAKKVTDAQQEALKRAGG
jgi:ABC-type glycerol-3-phosphate transport system substrate-binding protein